MKRLLLISLLLTVSLSSEASDTLRVMFWNVENYFDTRDDPNTMDEAFTPEGENRWTARRMNAKRNAIAKVIISTKSVLNDYPMLVGLAEVENRWVLSQLVSQTTLSKLGYDVIHRDSPDSRGIDVALIFRKDLFEPIKVRSIRVPMPEAGHTTRDILYVKGIVMSSSDTLHLYVNHWPSKLGGEKASLPSRMSAANTLRRDIDSLIIFTQGIPKIIIMGDFNDTPDSKPISVLLGDHLFNLATPLHEKGEGSLKYQGLWEAIDQFIVSSPLKDGEMMIFSPDFLLEEDKTFNGKKPKRTYYGPMYRGGISDHLPILFKQ